jgi:hypothetical protein
MTGRNLEIKLSENGTDISINPWKTTQILVGHVARLRQFPLPEAISLSI